VPALRTIALLTALSPLLALAQSFPPAQTSAETLLNRARQISDIRAPGSPPFHLQATFSFIAKNLDTIQGTYIETWLSASQWRRETVVGDAHRIEVRNGNKSWLANGGPQFPTQAIRAAKMFDPFPENPRLDVDSVTDRPNLQCVLLRLDASTKQAFCIDKQTGVLIGTVEPQIVGARIGDYSCQYEKFQKFDGRWFPHKIGCLLDRHRQIDGEVLELSPTSPTPDPKLFNPPAGRTEASCYTDPLKRSPTISANSHPDYCPRGSKRRLPPWPITNLTPYNSLSRWRAAYAATFTRFPQNFMLHHRRLPFLLLS
jgi:hypothetical protein